MCRCRTRRSLGRGRRQQRFGDAGKLQQEPWRPEHQPLPRREPIGLSLWPINRKRMRMSKMLPYKPMSRVPVCVAPALRFETESRRPRDGLHARGGDDGMSGNLSVDEY
ncbi:hypothetical protein MCOR21_001735 [Pyricularia oryzae]|nr:hypothetical protein MCOR30_003543 [Pyricularia oryzae]KAI6340546.1 hypothetical protein MCOR28_006520 [Pyricularia oryzae]KAI6404161.1 hypothetical protein MCOR23_003187 [Pyricularia oryzae]KAI6435395.1 hypothetical protein MCOR21_001735 [Pyricularia oryzae]KAI6439527.1 hypothetical protein MCOR22_007900 [Pyricularia oryzae]